MPSYLGNAFATVQDLMKTAFHNCMCRFTQEFLVIYMEDIQIFINGKERQYHYNETCLSRLKGHGLYIDSNKCEKFQHIVIFLPLIVGNDGICGSPNKI